MLRILLCFLLLFLAVPAFAGQLEDAVKSNDKVFLYIHTPSCGYCKKFDSNYRKLLGAYGTRCKFLKLDATTPYGGAVANKYRVSFVPFVVLINTKSKQNTLVAPDCLLDYACINKRVNSFVR